MGGDQEKLDLYRQWINELKTQMMESELVFMFLLLETIPPPNLSYM